MWRRSEWRRCLCQCHVESKTLHRNKVALNSMRELSSGSVYDVVISGGGMVGTAMAAAFGSHPVLKDTSVLLLESSDRKPYLPTDVYSNRVSALSPQTKSFLKAIGAWKKISSVRHQPVKRMYVWESCSPASISFNQMSEVDEEGNLAYLVENDLTVSALSESVDKADNVEVAYGTSVLNYKNIATADGSSGGGQELIDLVLSKEIVISARLVIGADGFNSLARRSANIPTLSWNYDQVGVVATLKLDMHEPGCNHTAWQRFLPTGPIALLPLSDTESSLVWSTTPTHGKHLLSLSPQEFVEALNHALNDGSELNSSILPILSGYSQILDQIFPGSVAQQLPPRITDIDVKSRAMFPFGFMHADKYVRPRLALVGDACHRIHPLAGQGVNLGFGDVESLITKLAEAAQIGADIGWTGPLLDYETERQRHVLSVQTVCDGLYRLYSNQFTPAVLARSVGLMTVNALSPIKGFFMQKAQNAQ